MSHEENCAHKRGHGTLRFGDNHPSTKLPSDARERAFSAIRRGEPVSAVARVYGVTASYLRRIYGRWLEDVEAEELGLPI